MDILILGQTWVRQKRSYRHPGEVQMKDEMDTEKITVRLPKDYITALDFLVRTNDFPSRSEAIRTALRDLIYQRLDLVMDKTKKMQDLKDKMVAIKALEEEFLKK